jgi:hypothetical protein
MLTAHRFTIEPLENGRYIARLHEDENAIGFCFGDTESEIYDMVADAYKTAYGIKVPWYDRWYASLKRLLRLQKSNLKGTLKEP